MDHHKMVHDMCMMLMATYGALTKMVIDLFSIHQHDLLWQGYYGILWFKAY